MVNDFKTRRELPMEKELERKLCSMLFAYWCLIRREFSGL